MRELIARIKIHFRGQQPADQAAQSGRSGTRPDPLPGALAGTEIALTATEFRLLEFLMSRPGVVFSREQLLDAVWGHDRAVTDRTVDVYVLRLRQKIENGETARPSFAACAASAIASTWSWQFSSCFYRDVGREVRPIISFTRIAARRLHSAVSSWLNLRFAAYSS